MQITLWIEDHKATVDLVKWGAILALAWANGGFRALRQLARKPHVELDDASFCYLEEYLDKKSGQKTHLAVFILDPSIKNPSDRAFEIDKMYLGYDTANFSRRFQQKVQPTSFPARPRNIFGIGIKLLPTFFTHFKDDPIGTLTVSGHVLPKSIAKGYVLYITN